MSLAAPGGPSGAKVPLKVPLKVPVDVLVEARMT